MSLRRLGGVAGQGHWEGIGFIPSQLALAWLLKRSPVMLPIPGTSSVAHLEENVAAAAITLSDEEFDTLSKAGASG